jgi:nitrous oxidase accessory protein NosD
MVAPLVLALLAPAGALHADLCTVPGDYLTITAAVAAAECTEVSVQAGTFSEDVTIQRSLSLHGIDASSTILEGRLQVEGAAVEVTLADLTVDAAGCFATGLTVSGEAQVQMPSGPVAIIDSGGGSSCPIFQDGFESGDTAAWSVTVP